jgi:hypothetical protein
MSAVTLFRALLLASVATGLAGSFIDLVFPSLIPESLSAAFDALPETPAPAVFGASVLVLLTFGGTVAAIVGLYHFQSWSRPLALVMSLLSLLFFPLLGASIASGWSSLLLEISATLWGAVLAMSYVSSLSQRFQSGISR